VVVDGLFRCAPSRDAAKIVGRCHEKGPTSGGWVLTVLVGYAYSTCQVELLAGVGNRSGVEQKCTTTLRFGSMAAICFSAQFSIF
jgi:hypothetical protein